MTSNKFDPTPLFDALPSFWREYYKDKAVLESVYEALLRIQEVDYNRLFTVDDSKALASTPTLTRYPVVYDKLTEWESLNRGHAHVKVTVPFDTTPSNFLGGEALYYRARFPGHVFKYDTQLFLDGQPIPAFLCQKSFESYIVDGDEVLGTTVYLPAERLNQFLNKLTTSQGLITEPVTSSDDYDSIEEDPTSSGDYGYLLWKPLSEVTEVTVYSYRDVIPLAATTDGTETEFDISIGDKTIDAEDSVVFLDRIDLTSKLNISYDTYTTITPKTQLTVGQLLRISKSDDSVQYLEVLSEGPILVDGTVPITSVELVCNLQIFPSIVSVSPSEITLTDNSSFFCGSVVRVSDNQGTQNFTITAPTNRIVLGRPVDVLTARVSISGVDLLNSELTSEQFRLSSAPVKDCRIRIDAVIKNDHAHGSQSFLVTNSSTTTLTISSGVLSLGAGAGNESENLTVRVYVDGTLKTAGTHYEIQSTDTIEFFDSLPENSKVSVFWDTASDPIAHRHYHQSVTIQDGAPVKTVDLSFKVSANDPIEIFVDASLYQDESRVDLVEGRGIYFESVLPAGAVLTLHGISRVKAYRHVLYDRLDSRYGYRGRIQSIGFIQDGITKASTTLSLESSDIEVREEAGDVILYSNEKIEDAWMFDVDVDERLVSTVWGSLYDIDEPSTDSLAVKVTALLAAARSASFLDNLVNFGSIVLGSSFLEEEGVSLGVIENADGTRQLKVRPTDENSEDFLVKVIDGEELRVADGKVMPRLFAVNKLLSVYDKDLSSVPWLAFMAEDISKDFRFAKRLDSKASKKLVSRPNDFNVFTKVLTDYSVNFNDEEIRVGDQVKLQFTIQDISYISGPEFSEFDQDLIVKVVEVINPNQIKLSTTDIGNIQGFGQGGYGSGPFGGSAVYTPRIDRYTIWTRATRRLDSGFFLDAALPSESALVSGEDVTQINDELNKILRHHIFAVKLSWDRMLSSSDIDTFKKLLEAFKPARTQSFVYTEVNDDAGIAETITSQLTESSPEMSVSGERVPDSLYSGMSFIGAPYEPRNAGTESLYNPQTFLVGPSAFALTCDADIIPKDQQYYLVASRQALSQANSTWKNLYSSLLGLEGLFLKSEISVGQFIKYSVHAPFGLRNNGRSMYLSKERRIRVSGWTYDSSDDFSFRTWINIPSGSVSPAETGYLVAMGSSGFRISIDYLTASAYTVIAYANSGDSHVIGSLSADTDSFICVSYHADSPSFSGLIGDDSSESDFVVTCDAVAPFSGNLTLGSSDGITVDDGTSLEAYYDETVILNRALSSSEASLLFNGRVWSSPLGIGYHGSPLAEQGAVLVYHYDRESNEIDYVLDYSGLGNNGLKESDVDEVYDPSWFDSGIINTPLPSNKDLIPISRDGYFVTPGFPQTIRVPNEDDTPFFSETLVRTNTLNYFVPNIAYYYSDSARVQVSALPQSFGSSVASNNWLGEYTGFTPGGYIGPDGEDHSDPMGADFVLASTPQITFTANNCGAISSITYDSTEILSVTTKADITGQRWEIGSKYVLAEAGADSQTVSALSKSRLVDYKVVGDTAVVSLYPAFSAPHTVGGLTLEASGNLFTKRLTKGFLNNERILEIDSTLQMYTSINEQYIGWVYQSCLIPTLTEVYNFNIGETGLVVGIEPTPLGVSDSIDQQIETKFKGGIILTNADRSLAFGIYHHGPSNSTSTIVADIEYKTGPNRVLFSSTEYNKVAEGVAYSQSKKRYICVGTFAEVCSAFIELYAHFQNISIPSNLFPASNLRAVLVSPVNTAVDAYDTVSVQVTAFNHIFGIDQNYSPEITGALYSGTPTLAGTLTLSPYLGIADFNDLYFTTRGSKVLKFTSGTLVPAYVAIDVENPKPVISHISPNSGVENDPPVTVHVYGSDFVSPSYVMWKSISDPSYSAVTTTFVSPGEVTFVATPSMQQLGRNKVIVVTPQPGGGRTDSKLFTSSKRITVSPDYIEFLEYPTELIVGQDAHFQVALKDSPSGAYANVIGGSYGRITLNASPIGNYYGTMTEIASPRNAIADFDGHITSPGFYRITATHSPVIGGTARSAYVDVASYNPNPVIYSLSPSAVSPKSAPGDFPFYVNIHGQYFANSMSVQISRSTDNGKWYSRATNVVSPKLAQVTLVNGDMAYVPTSPYIAFKAINPAALEQSNVQKMTLIINSGPAIKYPKVITTPQVHPSTAAYTQTGINNVEVNLSAPFTVYSYIFWFSPGSFPLPPSQWSGSVTFRVSPLGQFLGASSVTVSPVIGGNPLPTQNPVFPWAVGNLAVSYPGTYKIIARYNPASGEPSVPEATSISNLIVKDVIPTISKVSPDILSPTGPQTIYIYGSRFSSNNKVYFTNDGTFSLRSPTYTGIFNPLTFDLSPNDFGTSDKIATIQVGTPTTTGLASAPKSVVLKGTVTEFQEYLSFYQDNQWGIVPPPLNAVWRVNGPQGAVKVYAYSNNDDVFTSANGIVKLKLSPIGNFAGSYSGSAVISSGIASFPTITMTSKGKYRVTATHSPAFPPQMTNASPIDIFVLNNIGQISYVSPVSINPTSQGKVVRIYGTNFLAGDTEVLVDGSGALVSNVSVLSSTQIQALFTPAITNSLGTHSVSIKTNYAAAGGLPYTSSSVAPFTVVAPPGIIGSEENLPATIVVSPLGYARVRTPAGPITPVWTPVPAPALNYGSDSLWKALSTTAGFYNSSNPPGVLQATATSPGAADVVEVTAGMYSHIRFSWPDYDYLHPCGSRARGISKQQPLIIRARKTNGVVEPVVVRPNAFVDPASWSSTYGAIDTQSAGSKPTDYRADYIHFYDMNVMPNYYGIHMIQTTNLANGEDAYYEDSLWRRCSILGTYDPRTITLTPYRVTQSTQSNNLASQKHWNNKAVQLTSAAVSPRNSFLWRMDFPATEVHKSIISQRYVLSVPYISPNDLNPIPASIAVAIGASPNTNYAYTTGQTTTTSRLLHLGLDTPFSSTTPYYLQLTVQTDGEVGGGASARNNVQYYDGGFWRPIPSTGVIPPGVQCAGWPLAGYFVAGVAAYPNIIFRQPGYYHLKASILGPGGTNVWPTGVANDVYVQVTTPGASQREIKLEPRFGGTSAFQTISIPKLKSVSNLTSLFTLPVSANCEFNPYEQKAASAPMVNGTLNYAMDGAAYAAGWRWARYDGSVYSHQTLTGVMVNGFGNVYSSPPSASSGQQGIRLKYTGAGTPTVNKVTAVITKKSVFPAETTMTNVANYTIEIVSSTGTANLPFQATKNATWRTVDGGSYGGTFYSGSGRVFCEGWPGSPNHPNYDPETTGVFYPNPANCPFLTYPEGRTMKQGNQLYTANDYVWDGGFVGHIQEEHGFYFHQNRNVVVRNTLVKYTGRTGLQSLSFRQINDPQLSAPAANNVENVSQLGYTFVIENCVFKDCGIAQNARAVTVADYAGDVILRNNDILLGFNDKLRHWHSTNSGGIVIYDGGIYNDYLFNAAFDSINIYGDYFIDQFGRPVIDWQHMAYTGIARRLDTQSIRSLISPNDPYSYLRTLLADYPLLGFANGHPKFNNANLADFTDLKHPYWNRAYGHPRFSTHPYSKSLTITKPPAAGAGTGPSTTITLGSPTIGFYGGPQKVGKVVLEKNRVWGNCWLPGAVNLSTALSSGPGNAFVCGDWVTPGTTPPGMIYEDSTYASQVRTQGTGYKMFLVAFGGMRNLVLTENSFKPGNLVNNRIALNPKAGTASSHTYPPILTVTGHKNVFATSSIGQDAPFEYFTSTGGAITTALKNQLLSNVSPSPNLYF